MKIDNPQLKRLLSIVLLAAMVLTMLPVSVLAEGTAAYTQITTLEELVTGQYVMVTSTGYAPGVLDGTWITAAAVTEPDESSPVWTITVNDDSTVVLTDANGVSVAPTGGNENGISSGSYNWAVAVSDTGFTFSGTGEDTVMLASNKGAGNRFRAYKSTTISGKPNGYPNVFTLYQVTGDTEPQPETVEAPTASPEAGEVASGTEVTFSCVTEGAVIWYKTSAEAEYTQYTAPIAITEDTTFTVKATKDGMTDSEEVTFAYTVDTEDPGPTQGEDPVSRLVTDLAELTEGAQVVIFNPDNGKALSSVYSGYYNTGVDVALTEDVLCGYSGAEIWTVGVNEDGTYTFSTADGEKLSMGEIFNSTPLDDVNTAWNITEAATEGCFYIQNKVRGYYLEWYASKGNWSSYDTLNDEALFAQQLYLVVDEQTVSTPTADPAAGEVESGTTVSFACGTEGAEIYVKTGDGSWTLYTAPIAVTEDTTFTVKAQKAGMIASEAAAFAYTIKAEEPTTVAAPTASPEAGEVASGTEVSFSCATEGAVIWYKTSAEAEYTQYADPIAITEDTTFTVKATKDGMTDSEEVTFAYIISAPAAPILNDGDQVVIYNPANGKALSSVYSGFYNTGVDVTVTDGVASGYGDTEIWTVGVNEDGTYTFSTADGKKLSMGEIFNSTPLDDVNTAWNITEAATEGCYYIQNNVRGNYLEWYVSKGNWSSYDTINDEALFAQQLYLVVEEEEPPVTGGLPEEGDMVVIYNLSAQGVLAGQDDNVESPSITNAPAAIEDGAARPANGARVFKVEKNGDYYRFYNERDGYLCSNGTGSNAFYTAEASEDADWTLAVQGTGYTLESRTAKFNGQYSQYLEYYGGTYKTWSMYNVTDYTIYTFQFYPVAEDVNVSGGIVNQPAVVFGSLADAYVGVDYTLTFTLDAVFGVTELPIAKLGQTDLTVTAENGVYTVMIPADQITGETLTVTVSAVDTLGTAFTGTAEITVKDEPVFTDLTPAEGSETMEERHPLISAKVINAGENPTFVMTVNDVEVTPTYEEGVLSYRSPEAMEEGRTTVTITATRADGVSGTVSWFFTVGETTYDFYFGQLHSHTTYSDGSGSLESALSYVSSLPESANVDFVAFTDHSNYFDESGAANPEGALYDLSKATGSSAAKWNAYKGAIADFNASQSDVIAIAGFEMTWSGGPGHINTFNTEGIVSRNNTTLNNKTSDAGLKAYYNLLSQPEGADSISQFNHPGSTFGTFTDFAYWDGVIDTRIQLVEVGNGEGQIGAGGYYPSYEYYTMALDKGWHVAPTNNQDNHKGKWGNANDARDVILTDNWSEEGIYEAIRARRMYATEDKNLEITYAVNDSVMGSSISDTSSPLNFHVTVYDPDGSDSISKVELIVNSGKTAYSWSDPSELAAGVLTATLDPDYSYYYVKVTQGDGDLAVTAPVWVGESLKLGISSAESDTAYPVTGEALTLKTTFFNSEASDAAVKSITYTTNGSVVLGTDTTGYTIPASGTLSVDFAYTPDTAKLMTITVTAVVEQEGIEYTFTKDVTLDVSDADSLAYIGIDASHYNEYVAGNYQDSMGNFGALAAEYACRTVELDTSEELIAACSNEKYKMLILTAPSRRNGSALRDPYATYSDEEIAAIVEFNSNGGTVVLAGWSDYYEHYADFPAEDHMAAQQNKILTALGSSLRISDDGTNDDTLNGGQTQRLYFNTYGDSFLTEGVEVDPEHPNDRLYTEVFSHYGGASIYVEGASGSLPETVTPVVFAHSSTYSRDSDSDGLGGDSTPKYTYAEGDDRLLIMATEQLSGKGLIVVSGAAFMSNFEVQATIEDSGSEKNYSNYKICQNLLGETNPVTATDIAVVRAQTETGYKYTIEGIVTSNASGYDKDTAFFDCIYVQDATGGICCFPVAGNYKVGDKVRITGTTEFYQGEPELQVSSITVLSRDNEVTPVEVTAAQINDRSVEGQLITLKGTVESFELANDLVQTILVKDAEGNVARVFIDGYITTDEDVKNLAQGVSIIVTGLASYDDTFNAPEGPFPRIRVRDRADVVCGEAPVTEDYVTIYRVFNPGNGKHHYTDSTVERDTLEDGGWIYEGIAWYAPKEGDPIFRLYNPGNDSHLYTMDTAERDNLVDGGWILEGEVCKSAPKDDGVTIYRIYNPNATMHHHHYTNSLLEYTYLGTQGWHKEGAAWYGLKIN